MKAIGYKKAGAITEVDSLIEFDAPIPSINANDLLVEVHAISVNPVDTKVRSNVSPEEGKIKVIGYDAAGVVKQVGSDVSLFKVGDEVFYAGDLTRAGTNSELHAVDERIVGIKPRSLSFIEAAALPLTSITAWEILFDSFKLNEGTAEGESLLIIGAAGGVGSILIQLAKQLTGLTVVATASRENTKKWVTKMGADHVIDHHLSLPEQMKKLGLESRYVAILTASDQHFDGVIELIKPRGHIALIDDPKTINVNAMKPKALSLSWEFMFTRSMFQTSDMIKQHELLNRVSALVDDARIISTVTNHAGKMNIENLKTLHALQESGRAYGKSVLDGF